MFLELQFFPNKKCLHNKRFLMVLVIENFNELDKIKIYIMGLSPNAKLNTLFFEKK